MARASSTHFTLLHLLLLSFYFQPEQPFLERRLSLCTDAASRIIAQVGEEKKPCAQLSGQ